MIGSPHDDRSVRMTNSRCARKTSAADPSHPRYMSA
jgi:hypothetical protein